MKAMKAMKTKMSAKPAAAKCVTVETTWCKAEYPDGPAQCVQYMSELSPAEQQILIERARMALSLQADAETGYPATDLVNSLLRSGIALELTPPDLLPEGPCKALYVANCAICG